MEVFSDIHTPIICSSELKVKGEKTDRSIKLLQAVGGNHLHPSADAYLEKEGFVEMVSVWNTNLT
jgi:hypothetical protein